MYTQIEVLAWRLWVRSPDCHGGQDGGKCIVLPHLISSRPEAPTPTAEVHLLEEAVKLVLPQRCISLRNRIARALVKVGEAEAVQSTKRGMQKTR